MQYWSLQIGLYFHHQSHPQLCVFSAMILVFLISFKPALSLSSFTLIKRFFSFSSLSVIRVVSSAYLKWPLKWKWPRGLAPPQPTFSSPHAHLALQPQNCCLSLAITSASGAGAAGRLALLHLSSLSVQDQLILISSRQSSLIQLQPFRPTHAISGTHLS